MLRRFALFLVLLCSVGLGPLAAADTPLDTQMKRVESIRHLTFTSPVKVVTIGRAELPDRLRSQFAKGLPYPVSDWETILRALLLVEDTGEDVLPSLLTMYEAQVLAYYDPASKTYFAISGMPASASAAALPPEALEEGVAVHELTHALQDQRFDIESRDWALRNDNDANLAYHALLEGEATLVMLASFVEKMGTSFEKAMRNDLLVSSLRVAAAAEVAGAGEAPPYFTEMLKFPYLQGLEFVIEGYRRGGWEELDRVHRNPPRSTREILHPDEYFSHSFVPAKFDDTPAAGVTNRFSVEHLGEFHWRFLLGKDVARGWKADRVTVAADASCQPTVLVETEWDSAAVAARFQKAYTELLDRKGLGSLSRIEGARVWVAYGNDRPLMENFVR